MITASTTAGVVRGRDEDGLQVFRGVPYAAPAVGEQAWLAAEPVAAWSGMRDATVDGPVCPQPGRGPVPAMLGYALDPDAMSVDCLTVTVWTPGADDRRRPVVVWIHGGGFLTGAGTLPLYSGSSLAAHGDVVVVAVNYRVGPFGYLDCHPGDRSAGNRGLSDQALALQWVADNAAAFGGDPGNVTVVGQSGGAWSILTLLGMPATPPVRRAVLQSPPLGSPMRTADDDARILALHRSVLGVADDAALRALPPGALLAAVPEMIGRTAEWGRYLPVFQPHADDTYLRADVWDGVATHAPGTEIMIGWTSREFAFFFGREPRPSAAPPARLVELMRRSFGDDAEQALDRYRELHNTDAVPELLTQYAGDEMFRIPCLDRAATLAAQGMRVHAFEFAMELPGELGGAHCLELPFVFGTVEAMRAGGATLVRDLDDDTARAATAAMRTAWLGYARDGEPAVGATAGWAPFTANTPAGMVFCAPGAVAAATDDLDGPLRAVWDDLRVRAPAGDPPPTPRPAPATTR